MKEILLDHNQKNYCIYPRLEIGKNTSECRFCKSRSATYNNLSHSLPELLGNKSIFTINECDKCNSIFSDFENHLSRFIPPSFITQIKGKKGYSNSYVKGGGKIFATSNFIEVKDEPDIFSKEVIISNQKFSNVKVYKALLKCLISLLPDQDVAIFDDVIKWLISIKGFRDFDYTAVANIGYRLPSCDNKELLSVTLFKESSKDKLRYMLSGKFNNLFILLPFSFVTTEKAKFKTIPARSESEKFYFHEIDFKDYSTQHKFRLNFK